MTTFKTCGLHAGTTLGNDAQVRLSPGRKGLSVFHPLRIKYRDSLSALFYNSNGVFSSYVSGLSYLLTSQLSDLVCIDPNPTPVHTNTIAFDLLLPTAGARSLLLQTRRVCVDRNTILQTHLTNVIHRITESHKPKCTYGTQIKRASSVSPSFLRRHCVA